MASLRGEAGSLIPILQKVDEYYNGHIQFMILLTV